MANADIAIGSGGANTWERICLELFTLIISFSDNLYGKHINIQFAKRIRDQKYFASTKDKKDWVNFTNQIENIGVKEDDLLEENQQINKVRKIDLHGYSLNNANKVVKKFIIESFNQNYKNLYK